nr:5'/3'-nucleotidase SurE [Nocardioides thalensis]
MVTNDDGLSEGMYALRDGLLALAGVVDEVVCVVPDRNRSGSSRAMSINGPVEVLTVAVGASPVHTCTGSPLDCVRVGLLSDVARSVDLVVSGINHGANLGDDRYYSGTFGAALEGALLGRQALAVSQQFSGVTWFSPAAPPPSFGRAVSVVQELVRRLVDRPLPARSVLNVNVPAGEGAGRLVPSRPGRRHQRELHIRPSSPGRFDVWGPDAGEPGMDQEPDADYHVVARGDVAITLHTHDHAVIERARRDAAHWLGGE